MIDRMLGYLGLLIIGALGWTADRLADGRAAWLEPTSRPKTSHAVGRAKA